MIAYLRGELFFKNLKYVILMTGGVGYKVAMPLSDLSMLTTDKQPVSIYIHTQLREGSIELYGFLLEYNLQVFKQLINVSGIGPKLALSILSVIDPVEFTKILQNRDCKKLVQIPGIGLKMAQRLILELKDKMQIFSDSQQTRDPDRIISDLRSAMLNLGYNLKQINGALSSIQNYPKYEGENLFSELLKKALSEIK